MAAQSNPVSRCQDWSELPQELLIEIFSKLSWTCLKCKSVCKTWGSAYLSLSSLAKLYAKPCLLLPPDENDAKNNCLKFYSLDSPKLHTRKAVPQRFYSSKIIGCSFNCLIMLDDDMSSYLFNPFTLEQIQLAPLETNPKFLKSSRCNATLSDDPWRKNKNNLIVAIIIELKDYFRLFRGWSQVGFLNPGDKNWVWLKKCYGYFKDLIFHDDKLYVLWHDRMDIWILNNNSIMVKENELLIYDEPDFYYKYKEKVIKLYGEIHRIKVKILESHMITIKLYKLEFPSDGECRWIESSIESLKNHVFLCDALHVIPLPTYMFDGVPNSNSDVVSCLCTNKNIMHLHYTTLRGPYDKDSVGFKYQSNQKRNLLEEGQKYDRQSECSLPLWIVPQPTE